MRQLVELHGGTVTVVSEGAGLGSRFNVRLPLPHKAQPDPSLKAEPSTGLVGAPDLAGLRAVEPLELTLVIASLVDATTQPQG